MSSARKITLFDDRISGAHGQFDLPFDWRLLKAQLIAESALNPLARSAAGAQGIAQFMPATWTEVAAKLRLPADASPFDPAAAIKACACYMSSLLNGWSAPRPEIDRYCLALASYNAGAGSLLKAQKQAGGNNAYCAIIAALPQVTGPANAKQTRDYVVRILSEWQSMILTG